MRILGGIIMLVIGCGLFGLALNNVIFLFFIKPRPDLMNINLAPDSIYWWEWITKFSFELYTLECCLIGIVALIHVNILSFHEISARIFWILMIHLFWWIVKGLDDEYK